MNKFARVKFIHCGGHGSEEPKKGKKEEEKEVTKKRKKKEKIIATFISLATVTFVNGKA
jgi:hypothetical protein